MSDQLAARLSAFASHRPSAEVQASMTEMRVAFQSLAGRLDTTIPACREKALAFTALEEAAMWAMKALALTDVGGVVVDPPPQEATR